MWIEQRMIAQKAIRLGWTQSPAVAVSPQPAAIAARSGVQQTTTAPAVNTIRLDEVPAPKGKVTYG